MILYFRLLVSSFYFAVNSLKTNKLRTVLSLLGVTVGIFSIIAVLAAVDSLDTNIKKELSGFDSNMIYVFNQSFGPTDVPRWKREQFPRMKYEEYEYLKRSLHGVQYVSYTLFTGTINLQSGNNYASDVQIQATSSDAQFIDNLKIEDGRFFNEAEDNSASFVIVLGNTVAQTLYEGRDPIGQVIRAFGRNFKVIGVLAKKGEGGINIGGSMDERAYVPSNVLRSLYGENSNFIMPAVVVKPFDDIPTDEFVEEITTKLRLYRGVKPSEDDNFFVNVFGGFFDMVDQIIAQMNIMGWIISGFSLLVGGFGIANIMYVSVKERTHLIGVQKAIGAKKKFILIQFLFEAIILALIGGLVGIVLVLFISVVVSSATEFQYTLSLYNILIGLLLSVFIGAISGFLPARSASNLDPVEAIRSGI